MADYFVSYNQNDRKWAEWIAWTLEAERYSVIIQAWDFRAGQNFVVEMNHALKNSERMIAVLSDSYLKAEFPESEWTTVFATDPGGKNRRVIPVRVAPCDPDGLLGTRIYIDLLNLDQETAKKTLLAGLKDRDKPEFVPFPGTSSQTPLPPARPQPEFPGPASEASPAAQPTPAPDLPPSASWSPVWILLAFVGALLGVAIWQADRIQNHNLGFVAVTIYVVVGLIAALVLFGILKSTGLLKGKAFGSAIEFGGPAAIVALFFLAGVVGVPGGEPVTMQFELFDAAMKTQHVNVDGEIAFTLDSRHLAAVNGGYAVVSGVPYKDRRDDVTITDMLEGNYEVVNDKIRLDPNQVIQLYVQKKVIATDTMAPTATIPPTETVTTQTTVTSTPSVTTAVGAAESDEDTRYANETVELIGLLQKPAADLEPGDPARIEALTKSLFEIQKKIGQRSDWKDVTYPLLLKKQPYLLDRLKVPPPKP